MLWKKSKCRPQDARKFTVAQLYFLPLSPLHKPPPGGPWACEGTCPLTEKPTFGRKMEPDLISPNVVTGRLPQICDLIVKKKFRSLNCPLHQQPLHQGFWDGPRHLYFHRSHFTRSHFHSHSKQKNCHVSPLLTGAGLLSWTTKQKFKTGKCQIWLFHRPLQKHLVKYPGRTRPSHGVFPVRTFKFLLKLGLTSLCPYLPISPVTDLIHRVVTGESNFPVAHESKILGVTLR